MDFAIVEFKGFRKTVFDVIPVDWIYYFDKKSFKKRTDKSYITYWNSDFLSKAPLNIIKPIASSEERMKGRKDGQFYKIFIHGLHGNIIGFIYYLFDLFYDLFLFTF